MVAGRPYNLKMSKHSERPSPLPDSPPPSSPDSTPPPSHHSLCRRRRSKRLAVFKARHQLCLCIAATSPRRHSISAAEASQPPPPPTPSSEPSSPPPPPAAAGYSWELPMDISSDDEDKKPNIDHDPLSGLNPPPPRRAKPNPSTKFSKVIACVKSNLVSELISLTHSHISTMVRSANRDFTVLDCYEDDYTCFYGTVKRFIQLNQDLLEAEKLRNEHRAVFEEVATRYEELVIEANNAEEALSSAAMILAEAKENVVRARLRLEALRGLVIEVEREVGQGESEVAARELEVVRCLEFHSRSEVEMIRVGSEDEAARKVVDEAEEHYMEALEGIKLKKEELCSMGMP